MSLTDRLAEPKVDKGGRPCTLCDLLDDLDADERAAVHRAMDDLDFSDPFVARALNAEGHEQITTGMVGNCRREHGNRR